MVLPLASSSCWTNCRLRHPANKQAWIGHVIREKTHRPMKSKSFCSDLKARDEKEAVVPSSILHLLFSNQKEFLILSWLLFVSCIWKIKLEMHVFLKRHSHELDLFHVYIIKTVPSLCLPVLFKDFLLLCAVLLNINFFDCFIKLLSNTDNTYCSEYFSSACIGGVLPLSVPYQGV